MQALTLDQFFAQCAVSGVGVPTAAFEVIDDTLLRINLEDAAPSSTGTRLSQVWIKVGSMVACTGKLKWQHGLKHALKKAFSDEVATLVQKVSSKRGRAQLLLADEGRNVMVLQLSGDAVVVNINDLLAFEPTVKHETTVRKKIPSMATGGLFYVKLEGYGFVAILSHGKPIKLPVAANLPPVVTDAEATVAWSGNITCDLHSSGRSKTLFGRGSGESFRMKFLAPAESRGFVIVRPLEEHHRTSSASDDRRNAAQIISGVGNIISGLASLGTSN